MYKHDVSMQCVCVYVCLCMYVCVSVCTATTCPCSVYVSLWYSHNMSM